MKSNYLKKITKHPTRKCIKRHIHIHTEKPLIAIESCNATTSLPTKPKQKK